MSSAKFPIVCVVDATLLYQVNQKKSPLPPLLILQQCMGIFVRNFTRLLSDQIYTLSPSFIEIFLELTKLHSFNHDPRQPPSYGLCFHVYSYEHTVLAEIRNYEHH